MNTVANLQHFAGLLCNYVGPDFIVSATYITFTCRFLVDLLWRLSFGRTRDESFFQTQCKLIFFVCLYCYML